MSRIRRWLRAAIVVFGLTLVLLSLLRPELGKMTRAIKRLGVDLPDMATAPDGVATAPGVMIVKRRSLTARGGRPRVIERVRAREDREGSIKARPYRPDLYPTLSKRR
jgi:hypothetical protein